MLGWAGRGKEAWVLYKNVRNLCEMEKEIKFVIHIPLRGDFSGGWGLVLGS